TKRLYYTDSFLFNFDAMVTEIQELSRTNGQSLWRVALDRSAFYPTSGGQPHDIGTLVATARSGAELSAEIVGVEEDEHGELWHHTAKPLLPGTPVRGAIDRARRLNHIQQHSGQHLLSAAFFRICGARTISFHLGETVSTIDLATEEISSETLQQVESLVNQIIAEDFPFTVSTVSRVQAEAWLASGDLRKLPSRQGDLRIIEIGGSAEIGGAPGIDSTDTPFDRNACGGTHVRSSGQIGGLHLRNLEKVRDGWRVEFVCGLRAVRSAHQDFHTLTETARQLSIALAEVPGAVARLQSEGKQSAKEIQAQRSELAGFRAAELLREIPIENGLRLVRLQLGPTGNPAYAKLLAAKLTAQTEKTAAIFGWQSAQQNEAATVIVACSSDLDFNCGTILRQALGEHQGRGGGSKEMAQGSVAREHLEAVLKNLAAKARSTV
ncbi:MAG: DHHA1 domain-containing protein, partial [Acidobacteriaceae bacterium]